MHIMYDNDNSILTMLHKNISQINTRRPFSKLEYFLTNATMQIFVKICPHLEVIAKKNKEVPIWWNTGYLQKRHCHRQPATLIHETS